MNIALQRTTCVIAVACIVGCAPYTDSRPQTSQSDPILFGSGSGVVAEMIDLPGLPTALLTSVKGNIGLAVFQANTGEPYVTLGDTDGDGVFDMLVYYSLSVGGETLAAVEDYGMDGQPDFILNFEDNTGSVFYDGSWREVHDLGPNTPNATVEIDGEDRLLRDVLTEIGRRPF